MFIELAVEVEAPSNDLAAVLQYSSVGISVENREGRVM